MDPHHPMKNFFQLVQAHSEAQPYYPPIHHDAEVGRVFTTQRKIQIVWNACSHLFKQELVNLNLNRVDDFRGDYELCKTKFLLAEQHHVPKTVGSVKETKKDDDKSHGKGKGKGKPNKDHPKSKTKETGSKPQCGYCGGSHLQIDCFKDPRGPKYRASSSAKPGSGGGSSRNSSSHVNNKRKDGGAVMAFDEWQEQEEKRARYINYCEQNGVDVSDIAPEL